MKLPKIITACAVLLIGSSLIAPAHAEQKDLTPCKIQATDTTATMRVGWPKHPGTLNPIGSPKILVIGVDFADEPENGDAKTILTWVLQLNKIKEYFQSASGGLFNPEFTVVPSFVRMPYPSSHYGGNVEQDTFVDGEWQTHHLFKDATAEVGKMDNLDNYSAAMIVVTGGGSLAGRAAYAVVNYGNSPSIKDGSGNYIVIGKGAMNIAEIQHWKVIVHEINHLLGLADLYVYGPDGWWQGKSPGPFGQQAYLYSTSTSSLGWNLWLNNWIADDRIACQGEPKTIENLLMDPHELGQGTDLFIARVSENKVLVVEALSTASYDSKTYPKSLLVYTVDSSIKMGEGPVRIVPNPTKLTTAPLSPSLPDWIRFTEAPLKPGDYVRYGDYLIVNNAGVKVDTTMSFYVGAAATTRFNQLEADKRKQRSILCVKLGRTIKVTAVNPRCPSGYRKK
jgi:M6 family metalloprotease-like protein